MAETDRDVFEYFRRDSASLAEVDALAYALFAAEKYGWMAKFEETSGASPTQQEIDRWIGELPDSRLGEIKRLAGAVFKSSVDSFVEDVHPDIYAAGRRDALVERIVHRPSFWRDLPANIAIGVISSFAFTLLLILTSLIFNKDPSPMAMYHKYMPAPVHAPAK